jgi:hypothetical protein
MSTDLCKDGAGGRTDTRAVDEMLRTRGQQRRTVNKGGWAELPDELVAKVLELLQAAGRSAPLFADLVDWWDDTIYKPQAEEKASASLRPPPRCGWCARGGRPCTMRW